LRLGLAPATSSAAPRAQRLNRAGLVVDFGDGSYITRCVAFSEPTISGMELLLRSDLTVVAEGGTVCDIEGESGCSVGNCFCQCPAGGGSCLYWAYWHLIDGIWSYATGGATLYDVHDGDVEGWTWGTEAPPVVPFEQICTSDLADLSVSKTGHPGTAFASDPLTYTITVTNAGPHEAQDVVITDLLPDEVALVNSTSSQGDRGSQLSELTWDWGTLALQERAVLTLVVQVHTWVTRTFTNSVQVSSSSDLTPSNNSATATTMFKFAYACYLPVTLKRQADFYDGG
jgi:uncharacterized repeat protein (TIGR01451 family)